MYKYIESELFDHLHIITQVVDTGLGENNLCPDTEQGIKLSFQNQFTLPTTEADR